MIEGINQDHMLFEFESISDESMHIQTILRMVKYGPITGL